MTSARALVLPMLLACASCGEEPPTLVASVRIDPLLRDTVQKVSLFAFGPWRSSPKVMLTRQDLLNQVVDPTDPSLELLARADVAFDNQARQVTLDDVAAGDGRVVYVEAKTANDHLVGNGCVENVTVEEAATTPVEVVVYPPKTTP